MSDRRKLQGEIDRCLKKVSEGTETFDEIWSKVQNAANSNQKEKYEADLKKEIKKLQRFRDQIKTWMASNEIKDKRILQENRKIIETRMERFKVVEKETKTKAYSKEGLVAAARLDPKDKEKEETTNWLSQSIHNLAQQMDQFESETEALQAKRKKSERDKHGRIEELRDWREKHQNHINKLEAAMRMVDNNAIEPTEINNIREDIDYYIDYNQDPDFEENELIYDDLDLEEVAPVLAASPPDFSEDSINLNSATSPSPSPSLSNHSKVDEDRSRHKSEEESTKNSLTKTPIKASPSDSKSSSSPPSHVVCSPPVPTTSSTVHPLAISSHPTSVGSYSNVASGAVSHNNAQPTTPHSLPSTNDSQTNSISNSKPTTNHWTDNVSSNSSVSSNNFRLTNSSQSISSVASSTIESSIPSLVDAPVMPAAVVPLVTSSQSIVNHSTTTSTAASIASLHSSKKETLNGPSSFQLNQNSLKSIAQNAVNNLNNHSVPRTTSDAVVFDVTTISPSTSTLESNVTGALQAQTTETSSAAGTTSINLYPLLGMAPLGPQPLTREHRYQLVMQEAAYQHLPHPSDSEKLRHYLPRNPCVTPSYYPQVPPQHSDTVEFFQRLSTETLFFIFYYMEGTKAQYLAAKALKKQSWRFHTKFMMWFQRHEEPKTITEEYEQGTYIYFDYEKWGQRRKEGFMFEYRFLEDRDLN